MPYLIDTDWIIEYLVDDPAAVALLNSLIPQGIGISIITYMELYEGTLRSPNPQQAQARLQAFLTSVPLLPMTLAVARRCSELRHDLRRRAIDREELPIAALGKKALLTLPHPGEELRLAVSGIELLLHDQTAFGKLAPRIEERQRGRAIGEDVDFRRGMRTGHTGRSGTTRA